MDSEIEQEAIDKEKEEEIAKLFFAELDDARELISAEGGEVGLCPHCMDTGFIHMNKEGYEGIQARIDNEIVQYNPCYHGAPVDDGSLTF